MATKNIWDRFSNHYDIGIGTTTIYKDLIQKAEKALANCQVVVDIGCGTGNLTLELLKQGKEVYSCDNSEGMLAKTRSKLCKVGFENKINLSLRDAKDTGFKNNFFDGAILLNMLFYVKDPKKVLCEAFRILKPGGILVISGPRHNPNIKVIIEAAMKDYKKEGIMWTKKENIYASLALGKELVQSGINNTYESEELIQILINEIGFNRVVYYNNTAYLGQNHFVVVKK